MKEKVLLDYSVIVKLVTRIMNKVFMTFEKHEKHLQYQLCHKI